MYDFKLNKNEEIKLISDNTIIYNKEEKEYSSILTNKRLLILDYPSSYQNSMEELRITGRINYIRKKEVVASINLDDIISIDKKGEYYKITLKDNNYINLLDEELIKNIKK